MNYQQQIEKLTNQLAQVKARELQKKNTQAHREMAKTRKERNKRAYKVGGMVEKMGLFNLDEELLLGLLANDYKWLKNATAEQLEDIRTGGKMFLPNGKRLPPVSL